jgi:hypothetical protein
MIKPKGTVKQYGLILGISLLSVAALGERVYSACYSLGVRRLCGNEVSCRNYCSPCEGYFSSTPQQITTTNINTANEAGFCSTTPLAQICQYIAPCIVSTNATDYCTSDPHDSRLKCVSDTTHQTAVAAPAQQYIPDKTSAPCP